LTDARGAGIINGEVSYGYDRCSIEELQREVETLKKKVARLERRDGGRKPAPCKIASGLSEREHVERILRDAGLLAELTPEEKARAAEWRALPEARKREVILELDSLRLDPPLSQLIHDQRR
jgi:hypothetical protein